MRLLVSANLLQRGVVTFEEFYDDETPPYVILSHTWVRGQEITYQDCVSASPLDTAKGGFAKILNTCRLARHYGLDYVWIDTCCIDKNSNTELSEAINSMFAWYQHSAYCFVYLQDLDGRRELRDCRWFTRGWTLQELIAPRKVLFFDSSWRYKDTKRNLAKELSDITHIPLDILVGREPLESVCVAQKFAWASDRQTTRIEDMSYCLLGLVGINMPLLYGEGQRAFRRLQETFIATTYDLSILGWTRVPASPHEIFTGFLAKSVSWFWNRTDLRSSTDPVFDEGSVTVTSKGLRIMAPATFAGRGDGMEQYVLPINCKSDRSSQNLVLTVPMRKIGPDVFVRARNFEGTFSLRFVDWATAVHGFRDFLLLVELPDHRDVPSPHRPLGTTATSLGSRSMVRFHYLGAFSRDDIIMCPSKCWDVQDCAFFGSLGPSWNWGALRLENTALFLCFWGRDSMTHEWVIQATLVETYSDRSLGRKAAGLWEDLHHFAELSNYPWLSVRGNAQQAEIAKNTCVLSITGKERHRHVIWFDCKPMYEGSTRLEGRWMVTFGREAEGASDRVPDPNPPPMFPEFWGDLSKPGFNGNEREIMMRHS